MTPKDKQFWFKEAKKVIELLWFEFKVAIWSHNHFKNPSNWKKVTLPSYKSPYWIRLIWDIADQVWISKKELTLLATDKETFKAKKKLLT